MKSRITIDVDHDNQPVIKIEYSPSEDVRDKLVKKFLESFGSESCWTRTSYSHNPNAPVVNNLMLVRPIPPNELKTEAGDMLDRYSYTQSATKAPAEPEIEDKK